MKRGKPRDRAFIREPEEKYTINSMGVGKRERNIGEGREIEQRREIRNIMKNRDIGKETE